MDDFAAVPTVMLGTMTFGDTAGPETAADIVAAALDAGVRWFDTANSYSDGESERILGRLLAGRDDVLIATKVGQPQSALGTEHLLSAELVRRSVDDSLSRLGRDSVDVLYLHRPDRSTPIAETLGAVAALIEAGKVGRLGISNYAAWQIAQVAAEVTALGIPRWRSASSCTTRSPGGSRRNTRNTR
jgi:aryl-alcohol dehydrogenase-like predicted oxidoreductase